MRRRIVLTMLLLVAGALALAGVGTYVLTALDSVHQTQAQLVREAEVWVSLGFHPYIVPALWVRELEDQVFVAAFICPDAEGRSTLTNYIADGPLPLPVVCRWASPQHAQEKRALGTPATLHAGLSCHAPAALSFSSR